MPKSPTDPLRARLLELLEQLNDRTTQLRDYATVPGNAWLAKGELGQINQVVSDLETLLEQIKQADAENGY
ncbi:MAG TPA: hypothetical protein VLI05_01325 [Candidatus Saccharimonadia bacterium]|nr:hypothetical protein [Candidatus Saccharimonadia bacterium]